jgi:hypothetical protein
MLGYSIWHDIDKNSDALLELCKYHDGPEERLFRAWASFSAWIMVHALTTHHIGHCNAIKVTSGIQLHAKGAWREI